MDGADFSIGTFGFSVTKLQPMIRILVDKRRAGFIEVIGLSLLGKLGLCRVGLECFALRIV